MSKPESATNQTYKLFEAVKKTLRQKRRTYKDVARQLCVSEATIKRIFSHRNCDISRLAEICEAIGTSLIDVMGVAQRIDPEYYEFSLEVENFFEENLGYFTFYRLLSAGMDPETIASTHNLNQQSLIRYLQKLEELKLIERSHEKKILVMGSGYLRLRDGGGLQKKYIGAWAPVLLDLAIREPANENSWLRCSSTGLKHEHQIRFKREIDELLDRYRNQGYIDQAMDPDEAKSFGIVIATGPIRVGHGMPIPRL